ncbi:hypothetical protein GGF42_006078 [Coemansia sp. RSA 2424]|nr:hypothetical protein GGF42_006078 [Coemansia sp. RSA 2424]
MCASSILGRSKRRVGGAIRRFLFDNNYLCDEYFTTSYIVPQRALLGIRILAFAYCAAVLVSNLASNIAHGAGWSWAVYFTSLTFCGITLYYLFAAYNTARHLFKCRGAIHRPSAGVGGRAISRPAPLPPDQLIRLAASSTRVFGTPASLAIVDSRANGLDQTELDHIRLLQPSTHTIPSECHFSTGDESETIGDVTEISLSYVESSPSDETKPSERAAKSTAHQLSLAAQWILYELFTCYAPLVSLVYWVALYPSQGGLDTPFNTWMGISMHGINTVLMALEVFVFARCSYRWTHAGLVLGLLVLYLAFVYMMVGVYGFYVYPFFEAEYFGSGGVGVICLVIIDIVAIAWIVMLMIHRWRDSAYPRRWPPIPRTV